MGSLNPNPGTGTNPEQEKQQTIRQELNSEEKPVISRLINSILYYIECVFIMQSKDKYRLVVLHQRKVLWDKYYSTPKDCRIAFQKLFKDKAWEEEIKAEWSHFYDPDKLWLEEKFRYMES